MDVLPIGDACIDFTGCFLSKPISVVKFFQ